MKLSETLDRSHSLDSRSDRKHIPWISSPLEKDPHEVDHPEAVASNMEIQAVQSKKGHDHLPDKQGKYPRFKKRYESSTIELFHDLFFVANLTTFTSDHEISNTQVLGSYMGFFCLLWFTWLQTSLFDVRFSSDSIFSRMGKIVSFGVMTGFVVVGSQYDTKYVADNTSAFRAMSLILMVSRLALVVQYGMVCWYVRSYKMVLLPLASTTAILFLTAMAFLGLFFAFEDLVNTNAYIGWQVFPLRADGLLTMSRYVLITFEAATIIAVSCCWRGVSFKRTYLVERIGLLTLIIIGEGIINMARSVATTMQNAAETSVRDVGVIAAGVLLIYFIWVLYFDQIEHDRFGTIRQQIWTILHFPLHVALLLTVEGSSQLIVWNTIVEELEYLETKMALLYDKVLLDVSPASNSSTAFVSSLMKTLSDIDFRFKETHLPDFSSNLTVIEHLNLATTEGKNETLDILAKMEFKIGTFILETFHVELPHVHVSEIDAAFPGVNELEAAVNVFSTVLLYFLIGAGCFLIILAFLYSFGKKHKTRNELVSVLVRLIAGLGLALLGLLDTNEAAFDQLLTSAWTIPIVVIVYATGKSPSSFTSSNESVPSDPGPEGYEYSVTREYAELFASR